MIKIVMYLRIFPLKEIEADGLHHKQLIPSYLEPKETTCVLTHTDDDIFARSSSKCYATTPNFWKRSA